MASTGHDKLDLIATHLCVPHEKVLSYSDVAEAMRSGRADAGGAHGELASALILSMFSEMEPRLIAAAMAQAHADASSLIKLYRESLGAGFAHVPEWDAFTRMFG